MSGAQIVINFCVLGFMLSMYGWNIGLHLRLTELERKKNHE